MHLKSLTGIIKRFTIIDTIADTVRGFINPIKGLSMQSKLVQIH